MEILYRRNDSQLTLQVTRFLNMIYSDQYHKIKY